METRSRLLRWLGTALILCAGLFFLALFLAMHVQLVEARKLMETGARAEGTVTQMVGASKRSGRRDFTYAFRVGTEQFAKTVTGVGYDDYSEMRIGQTIVVRYRPDNPDRNITQPELTDLESWANRLFGLAVGLALIGWGIARIVRRPGNAPASSRA
jgi:hypothetical protein